MFCKEPPDSLSESQQHNQAQGAVQQVRDYILGASTAERHEAEKVLGVAFDGHYSMHERCREGALTDCSKGYWQLLFGG